MGMLKSDPRPQVHAGPELGAAKQSFKDACDINNILAGYRKTGMITHINSRVPEYRDVSAISDFRTALDHVAQVDEFFMGLPAKVRAHFDNDPAAFLDFMNDPDTKPELLEEYGLALLDDDPSNDPPKAKPPEKDKPKDSEPSPSSSGEGGES